MDAFFTLVMAVGAVPDGINIWGMLGCAVAYSGAVLAAVDGLGDHILNRASSSDAAAIKGATLKAGSKLVAAAITIVTAGTVLVLDNNWIAFVLLTIAAIAVVLWVFYVYREANRGGATEQTQNTLG